MKEEAQIVRNIERIILYVLIFSVAKLSLKFSFVKDLLPQSQLEIFIFIIGIIVMSFSVIAFHELGHIIVGLVQGFRFELFVVGPIGIKREKDKIALYFNKEIGYYGGASATYPINDNNGNVKKFGNILLAGPIASLLFALFCLSISFLIKKPFGIIFFIGFPLSTAIFLTTTIPSRSGMFFSDRKRFQRLNNPGKDRKVELALLNISSRFMIENSYKNVKMVDIDELTTDENSFIKLIGLFTLLCYQIENNGIFENDIKEQYDSSSLELPKSFVKKLNIELKKHEEKYKN